MGSMSRRRTGAIGAADEAVRVIVNYSCLIIPTKRELKCRRPRDLYQMNRGGIP